MSTLAHKFNKVAIKSTSRDVDVPNCLPPFSIRFTFEERVRLDEERGRKTLAAHIRDRLFGQDAGLRRKPGNRRVSGLLCMAELVHAS